MGDETDKSLSLPFDFDMTMITLDPAELRMESCIEDAVETAQDILIRMQMMEQERMMEQVRICIIYGCSIS